MWITWNYKESDFTWPLSFDDKVEIFYERALGWQLHVADPLANGGQPLGESFPVQPLRHSGFTVLQICLSYFETVGHYEQRIPATSTSTEYFKEGVRSVFPHLFASHDNTVSKLLARFYKGARCGLYHNSMTVPGVGLGQPHAGLPIAYDSNSHLLVLSPERLSKALKCHLDVFRSRLLDRRNFALRRNFECRFDTDNGISGKSLPGPRPGVRR